MRRGPKSQSGTRTPSGRLSRAKGKTSEREQVRRERAERDAMSVAVDARQRVFGVTKAQATTPYAGDVIGRLLLNGPESGITQNQHDAARQYMRDQLANSRISCGPKTPGAINLNAIGGRHGDNDINIERDMAIAAKYKAARQALSEAQSWVGNRGNLIGAINTMVEKDTFASHLIGDLRLALNALSRHYGLSKIT